MSSRRHSHVRSTGFSRRTANGIPVEGQCCCERLDASRRFVAHQIPAASNALMLTRLKSFLRNGGKNIWKGT